MISTMMTFSIQLKMSLFVKDPPVYQLTRKIFLLQNAPKNQNKSSYNDTNRYLDNLLKELKNNQGKLMTNHLILVYGYRSRVCGRNFIQAIWNLNLTHKLKLFACKLIRNALLTRDKLRKIDINVDRDCSICHKDEENVDHLSKIVIWPTMFELLLISIARVPFQQIIYHRLDRTYLGFEIATIIFLITL